MIQLRSALLLSEFQDAPKFTAKPFFYRSGSKLVIAFLIAEEWAAITALDHSLTTAESKMPNLDRFQQFAGNHFGCEYCNRLIKE